LLSGIEVYQTFISWGSVSSFNADTTMPRSHSDKTNQSKSIDLGRRHIRLISRHRVACI
jgi:hypothetical protein